MSEKHEPDSQEQQEQQQTEDLELPEEVAEDVKAGDEHGLKWGGPSKLK